MRYKSFFLVICLICSSIFAQEHEGEASYYPKSFDGQPTASGEAFSSDLFTAAHCSLPFDTMVKVTNLRNNKSVTVKINDRGPFVEGRIIDLSRTAAKELGFIHRGITKVRIEVVSESQEKPDTTHR